MRISLAALFLGFASSASADGWDNQLFSAGLGTSLGGSHVQSPSGTSVSGFSSELSFRLHGLYVLGFDFAYAPVDTGLETDGLSFGGALRMSALLYVVPTAWASLYGKVGVEADGFGGLFDWASEDTAFHLGGGVEVPITDNWYVGAEFLVLTPRWGTVEDHVAQAVEDQIDLYRAGAAVPQTNSGAQDAPGVSDYFSGNNFRLTATVRYYF